MSWYNGNISKSLYTERNSNMATFDMSKLPRIIDGGKWNTGHVQGITVDTAHQYI